MPLFLTLPAGWVLAGLGVDGGKTLVFSGLRIGVLPRLGGPLPCPGMPQMASIEVLDLGTSDLGTRACLRVVVSLPLF